MDARWTKKAVRALLQPVSRAALRNIAERARAAILKAEGLQSPEGDGQ